MWITFTTATSTFGYSERTVLADSRDARPNCAADYLGWLSIRRGTWQRALRVGDSYFSSSNQDVVERLLRLVDELPQNGKDSA